MGERCTGMLSPGRGTRRARGRGLARRHPAAPPRDRPQQQGPPLPRPPLAAAAAPASAQHTRSLCCCRRCRCRCRTCHHVAAAGSCLTLSGPRFPISRCPPSPAAACSAAPRGRPPTPTPYPGLPGEASRPAAAAGRGRDAARCPAAPEVSAVPSRRG